MLRILCLLFIFIISTNLLASEQVVFLKESPKGASLALFNTKTKVETQIDTGDYDVIYPTISTDGKLVAFSGSLNQKDWGIYVYHLQSQKITEVIAPSGLTIQPSFSGNTNYLAFTAPVQGKNQIHVLNYQEWKKNQNIKAIPLETKLAAYYPYMSSAGFKVTFHLSQKVNDKKVQQIAIFDIREKKLIELKDQAGANLEGKAPCFNLDDSKLAFVTSKGNDKWSIREFDIDQNLVKELTPGHDKDYSPRYITGKRLLFSSNRSGLFKLYTLDLDLKGSDIATPNILHKSEVNIWDPRSSGNLTYEHKKLKSIGGEARSSFGAVTVGESIYVIGGHKGFEHTYPPESFSRDVYRYDLKSDSWTRLADKINPVHGVTVAHYKGHLYAFGGFAHSANHIPKWKSLKSIERYNIAKNKWEHIGDLPEPRSSNAIAVMGEKVYLIGGWNATPKHENDTNGTFHKSVVLFNMETETASYAPFKVPAEPRRAFTATTQDGKIIIGGGITQGSHLFSMLDEVWSIDPSKESSWSKLPSLPFANFAPAMISLKGALHMFGGMKLTKDGYSYVNHIYKLEKNKWIHTGRFLKERKGFIQPVLINGKAGLLGGHSYDHVGMDGPVSTFEMFF